MIIGYYFMILRNLILIIISKCFYQHHNNSEHGHFSRSETESNFHVTFQKPHCVKSVQIWSFFQSIFSCIRTEYEDLLHKSQYSVGIWENMYQKKLRIWALFTQCQLSEVSYILGNFPRIYPAIAGGNEASVDYLS